MIVFLGKKKKIFKRNCGSGGGGGRIDSNTIFITTVCDYNRISYTPCKRGLEYADCTPCRKLRPPPKKSCPKLHLVVRLQFWSSGESGLFLNYHYSQVLFDSKW